LVFFYIKYPPIIIASNILSNKPNAVENYMKFLSSGSSKYPLEILSNCGIDITDKKVLENAFNLFESRLNELKELIEVK
jgi:oligoendopeptidase F